MFDIAGGASGGRTLCVIAAEKLLGTFDRSRTTWRDDMNWYVFSTVDEAADESFVACGSYREAVIEAQCKHDTQNRPVRTSAGFYTIRGEHHSSYIVADNEMQTQGFEYLLTSERQMKRPNTDGIRHQKMRKP